MNHIELERKINDILTPDKINDYCPNGLQVEGRSNVSRIITGVTACQALIDVAIEKKADAILVHHGYFWRGEVPSLRGMKYQRIKSLIDHKINLYAYHLPLDIHPELGNNAQLAKLLNITVMGSLEVGNSNSVAVWGEFAESLTATELVKKLNIALNRQPLHIGYENEQKIKKIGWCTGGGQDFIDLAAQRGMDAFISGEVSERTTFSAREQRIHYFSAGHHATERYGIKALGEWLSQQYGLDVEFVDIDNPV